jgi:phosphohistidine phosphatase
MDEPVLLYLVRHGLAEERGHAHPDDSLRRLTAEGVERMREEGKGLRALGVEFDEILTSPFVRARQTAEALAGVYSRPPRVTDVPALGVDGSIDDVLDALGARTDCRSLALVGHAPDIGVLAARLMGARPALEFKKGAVCCIEVAALPPVRAGALRWFLTPRMLRDLGRRA